MLFKQLPGAVGRESPLVFPASGKSKVGSHRVRRRGHHKASSGADEVFCGVTDRFETVEELVVRKGIGRNKPEDEGRQRPQFHRPVILCIGQWRMEGRDDLPLSGGLHLGKSPLDLFRPSREGRVFGDSDILEKRTGEQEETG